MKTTMVITDKITSTQTNNCIWLSIRSHCLRWDIQRDRKSRAIGATWDKERFLFTLTTLEKTS